MEEEATKVMDAQETAKKAAQAKEEELKEISAKFNELQDVVKTVQVVKVDLASNVDQCSKLLKDNEARRVGLQKEMKKVLTQHNDDMAEYQSFVITSSPSKAFGGEEETKGESSSATDENEEVDNPKNPILRALREFSSAELDRILSVAASAISTVPSRGKGRARALPTQREEEEDEEETVQPADSARRDGIEGLKREINLMEADRDRLKGSINMTALGEFKKKDDEYKSRLGEVEEVTVQRNAARKEYEDLRRKRLEEFMSGFGTITLKLKEMYQMITLGNWHSLI